MEIPRIYLPPSAGQAPSNKMSGTVYLLHFERPVGGKLHYIGFTRTLKVRLWEHATDLGSRMTRLAKENGIQFQVAAVWPGDAMLEQRLKKQKNSSRLCPVCNTTLKDEKR